METWGRWIVIAKVFLYYENKIALLSKHLANWQIHNSSVLSMLTAIAKRSLEDRHPSNLQTFFYEWKLTQIAALLPRGLTLCKFEDGPFRHKGNSWWKKHIFFKGTLWKVIGIADNWWYLATLCPLSHLLPLVSLQGKYYHFLHMIK